jgi:hypothetical protein
MTSVLLRLRGGSLVMFAIMSIEDIEDMNHETCNMFSLSLLTTDRGEDMRTF